MMWGQPPPTYNTADPWYDGAANYDYGAGQEVEQRWAVLDGALNSYLGGQDVPPPPPAPQYQQTQSWDEQASKNAQRWAKESSGYAAQAQAQAARLGLAAGGVGDLASSVGHLSAAVQRMEERTALVQERDAARMRCLELEQALAERQQQIQAPPSAPASPMRLPAPVQSPPLSPAPSERAPVHSSPVATSTTGLPPRAQSMRTSTTGLSQAIVPQPEDPAEARRQAIFRERQVILAERQLLAERRKLEEEMAKADAGEIFTEGVSAPPSTVTHTHHPELAEARVQIANLHGEMKEMRALISRRSGSPRASSERPEKRSRPESPLNNDEAIVRAAQNAREDAKRDFEKLREELASHHKEELSSHHASLRDQHEQYIATLHQKHEAHLESHKTRAEAEAEAVRLKAAAEVEAMKHRLEMALEKEQSAREQQEAAHERAVRAVEEKQALALQAEQRMLALPEKKSVSESHVGRLVSQQMPPQVTESRIGALLEEKMASQQPGVSESQIARLMDERMRSHQPALTESQLGRIMDEKLSQLTSRHAQDTHELQAKHLELVHGKIQTLTEEQAKHRGELRAAQLEKDAEIAALKLQLERATQHAVVQREAPLQQSAPVKEVAAAHATHHATHHVRREAPLQAAAAVEQAVAAPAAHHRAHHAAKAPEVETTIKKEKKKPSAVWTSGKTSRLKKAVKVTWGKGPKPTANQIRAALVEYGVVTKVGETPHGKSELVLFGSEHDAENAISNYNGPWRLRPAAAGLEDPFGHVPSPEKAAPSRFAARTVEVTWNDSVPPSSDKELRAQLSYFGDVTRSFRTGHRGVVMFSNHEGAHRCIEDYRGPWSVRLVNAKRVQTPKAARRPSTKEEVAARALRVSWRGRSSPPSENDVRDALSNFGTVARCQSGSTHAVVLFGSSAEANDALTQYQGPWKLTKAEQHTSVAPPKPQTPAAKAQDLRKATRKVTWSSGAAVPTEDQLRAVLNAYGPVRQVALKKRSAIVMFRDENGAKNADENYRGPWRLNELGAPGETPKTPPPTVHKPSPRAHHSPPRHMKPLESEVVREAPLQHQAPVVQEEAVVSHKKHHHKAAAEEDHKPTEEEDDVPPPPAKKPARLTAEALAKLEAETTQKKAPLPERCVNITWPKNHKATEAGVMEVLRAFGCSDVVKVSCRTKSAVTLFATPAAAKKAVSKIRDASGTVEGYDMSTWKAFLASEALAIRASKSSAPLSPQKPPSVASSALRRSQEREEQRQKMASEQPTPVVQGELWKRCVKVTYMGGYKPTGEAQLALDVEQAGGAPFVNAKLKKKSAVLLFSCTADAECDKF